MTGGMRLSIEGAELACRVAGPPDGDPVLLLHGYLGSGLAWRHQLPALAGAGRRVVAPDWFGWGDSTRTEGASFEADVARIGRIADALVWEGFDLIGHDYGGFIGLGFALTHPERVRRLGLLNSRAHATFRPRWRLIFGGVSALAGAPGLRHLLRLAPVGAIHRWMTRRERREGVISRKAMRSYTRQLDAEAILHIFGDYRVRPRPELAAGLDRLRGPAGIVWGDRDRYLSARIARELAAGLPDAELTWLEGAGHFVMEERPEAVNRALQALLARPVPR